MTFLWACFITRIELLSKCSVCVVQRWHITFTKNVRNTQNMCLYCWIYIWYVQQTRLHFFLFDAVIIRKFQFCCFNIKLVFAANQKCFSCWLVFDFNMNFKTMYEKCKIWDKRLARIWIKKRKKWIWGINVCTKNRQKN